MQSGAKAPHKTDTHATANAAAAKGRDNSSLQLPATKGTLARLSTNDNRAATLSSQHPAASVDKSFLLQAGYFVLHQQLATLKCHDLKIIDRWMGPRLIKFSFEGPMAFYQFRKMGFYGHVVQFSFVSCADNTYYTGSAGFRSRFRCCTAAIRTSDREEVG